MGVATMMWWLDGKTCKRGFEVAPIALARFSMYKNQARIAQEKENEASDREKAAIEREKVAKRRDGRIWNKAIESVLKASCCRYCIILGTTTFEKCIPRI
ncbi:hypothetical protein SO802_011198 [Lithocarpus litseifolius]|uniref:Uncharacterized protein n=1 Tax=Lithocarpus litseifolius TaxID=425828 RepID=A0AAW2CZ97_9ROSI